MNALKSLIAACSFVALSAPAFAVIQFDQDVTNTVIFGGGNSNGSYTTDRSGGVELGLRGKLRYNASGQPENTYNSNGDGTYTFVPGVAPTQSSPKGVWSFEWSINTNYTGSTSWNLADLTYELTMTSTTGAYTPTFDPIHAVNPGNGMVLWDHSMGTNATGNGAGVEASSAAEYDSFINSYNLAQQSWQPQWYAVGYDPEIPGAYTYTLSAYDGANQIASTSITILTPEPASLGLIALGGLLLLKRRHDHTHTNP